MENQSKKLRLDELTVKSFVTSDAFDVRTVRGGTAIEEEATADSTTHWTAAQTFCGTCPVHSGGAGICSLRNC